jgi:two-component system, LytTR family, sensor kinase
MKKTGFLLLFCSFYFFNYGQVDLSHYSTSYAGDPAQKKPMIIIARLDNGMYTAGLEMSDAYPQFRNDSIESPENTRIYDACDSSEVHFFVNNIYKNNAQDYEFRVLENWEKELLSWQPIRHFADDTIQINNFNSGMAYLGGFKIPWNKYLIIEIKDKKSLKIVEKTAVYGQQIKPEILTIYTLDDLNIFLKRLKENYNWNLSPKEKKRWTNMPNSIDSNTFLPKNLILEPIEDNLIFYLKASIFDKKALEYQLIKDGNVFVDWQANDFDNNFIWLKNLEYGNYTLLMRFAIQRHNVSSFSFIIKPEWYQTGRFQLILGALTGIFILLIIFLFKQRIRINKAKKEKQGIDNELKAIRSQLNPHFVFNALSSIQGLINKNEIALANYYLSEFSHLLRGSLVQSNKEFVPLNIELKTLETYIKLENLRFPFTFSLEVDKNLNTNAIEIPYLLLQPLVENAIKHGVSNLYEKGEICLNIYGKNADLIIELSDNGKGFDTKIDNNGYGLKLTKERVRLLNASNSEQLVSLTIQSDFKGTKVFMVFKNWL